MWMFLSLVIAVIAIPLVIEASRAKMDDVARADAPGQFAQLSKGTVHYQWFGPEGGPILVCVHGLTTPSFVWRRILKGLAVMGFRILTYDHYGRGFSDRPLGAQNAKFFADELDELLEHQGVGDQSISVLGYSMGGAIAAVYAARNVHRITRVILIASAGTAEVKAGVMHWVSRVPVLGDWLMLAVYPTMFRRGIAQEGDAEIGALQERELQFRGFVRSVLASLRGIIARPQKKAHVTLADQGISVLAIWGEADALIPISAKEQMSVWNPAVVHGVVEGGPHSIPYSHPEEVLGHIRAFLAAE